MTAGEGACDGLRLKAKEKVLLQLYLHRSEPDPGVFPFEVTQKGLSDHLGLRRSHVAVALQELVRDGLVDVSKGHVEGADRRQNAYCVTLKGAELAADVRARVFDADVPFEDSEGLRTAKVSEIVNSRKASLASVISQLDRGGPVRDEIAVMTGPERKMISVFCPTCKKQIEVDNIYKDDEVGFDCPGCGRPYRIVPALKREEPAADGRRAPSAARDRSSMVVVVMLFASLTAALSLYSRSICLAGVVILAAAAGLLFWMLGARPARRPRAERARTKTGSVVVIAVLGVALLFTWSLFVASIHVTDSLAATAPVWILVAAGYGLVTYRYPELRGDYMVASGLLLVLLGATIMFLVDLGGLNVSTVPFLGITAAVLLVLSTFHPLDKDAVILDSAFAVGAVLVMLAVLTSLSEGVSAADFAAAGAVAVLGTALASLRVMKEVTGAKDLSTHVVAVLPMAAAAGLLFVGALLILGGETVIGLVDIGATVPLAYLGFRPVTGGQWPQRVPLLTLVVAAEILVITAGLVV